MVVPPTGHFGRKRNPVLCRCHRPPPSPMALLGKDAAPDRKTTQGENSLFHINIDIKKNHRLIFVPFSLCLAVPHPPPPAPRPVPVTPSPGRDGPAAAPPPLPSGRRLRGPPVPPPPPPAGGRPPARPLPPSPSRCHSRLRPPPGPARPLPGARRRSRRFRSTQSGADRAARRGLVAGR